MEINLVNLIELYHNEDDCRKTLESLKWPNGVKCPRCGSKKVNGIKNRDQFYCDNCHYNFSVTAGSIFHDSHLPLWKWFLAIYLMIESKKRIFISYDWQIEHNVKLDIFIKLLHYMQNNGVREINRIYKQGNKKFTSNSKNSGYIWDSYFKEDVIYNL